MVNVKDIIKELGETEPGVIKCRSDLGVEWLKNETTGSFRFLNVADNRTRELYTLRREWPWATWFACAARAAGAVTPKAEEPDKPVFEAYLPNQGFGKEAWVRGQGDTLEAAEDAAWARFQAKQWGA